MSHYKKMIILIGVSGSGKTTYISNYLKNSVVCSADSYFLKDGRYEWDGSKIGKAHEYCQAKTKMAVLGKEASIVIDNQNLLSSQREYYINLARENGYSVEFICFKPNSASELVENNAHNLSLKKIEENIKKTQWPSEQEGTIVWENAYSKRKGVNE